MDCPQGYKEVLGVSLLGNLTVKCVPDEDTDLKNKIHDAEIDVQQAKAKADAAGAAFYAELERRRAARSGEDTTGYPTMTEVPGPATNIPSRANQKANLFNKAFDPRNRKIVVLLIAGFLLFLAVTNYE